MGLFSAILGNAGAKSAEELTKEYSELLTEDEKIEIGFIIIRDVGFFTNKRLVFVDKQGITGKKTSYLSIPYHSIVKYTIQTSGTFDLNAELFIWCKNDVAQFPTVRKRFSKSVNIYDFQKVLSKYTLK